MGSGFSQKKKKADSAVTKVGVINAFSIKDNAGSADTAQSGRQSGDASSKRRSDVYDFVRTQKQEKEDNWNAVGQQLEGHGGRVDEEDEEQEKQDPLYDYSQGVRDCLMVVLCMNNSNTFPRYETTDCCIDVKTNKIH